jgi:mono/diheme cytochrome c family protein
MPKSISIVLTMLTFFGCAKQPSATQTPVERGKYLVSFGGCHDCHTPKTSGPNGTPVLDTSSLLSGHPENAPVPFFASFIMQVS